MRSPTLSHRLQCFDGLRALGALVVLVHHFRLAFLQEASKVWLHSWVVALPYVVSRPAVAVVEAMYNGTFAVWVFWALSGFVLSVQYFLRNIEQSCDRADEYLEEAVVRRYPRLCGPALASVLLAWGLEAAGWMHNAAAASAIGAGPGAWLGSFFTMPPEFWRAMKSVLWDAFFQYDSAASYNSVLWTMEKEFLGSLFLFAFLALVGRSPSRWVLYPVCAAVLYGLGMQWLNGFVGGCWLCDLFVHRHLLAARWPRLRADWVGRWRGRGWPALLIWLAVLVCVGSSQAVAPWYPVLSVGLVGLTLVSRPAQRCLGAGWLVFLGKISYCVYLVHVPVLCSFGCWVFLALRGAWGQGAASGAAAASGVAVSLVGGWALYWLADWPATVGARRMSGWVTGRQA